MGVTGVGIVIESAEVSGLLIGVVFISVSLINLAVVYGLWNLAPWAWMAAVVLHTITTGVGLVAQNIGTVVVGLGILGSLWIIRGHYGY